MCSQKYWQDLGLVIGLLVCIYVAVDWEIDSANQQYFMVQLRSNPPSSV